MRSLLAVVLSTILVWVSAVYRLRHDIWIAEAELFLGQYLVYCFVSAKIVDALIIKIGKVSRYPAVLSVASIWIIQIAFAWLIFGAFFVQSSRAGYVSDLTLGIDQALRFSLAFQQACFVLMATFNFKGAKAGDIVGGCLVAMLVLIVAIPVIGVGFIS